MYLKPHGEAGGNKFLYFLYAVDILDKHKLLIPAANYTDLSSKMMRQQIPDWPPILGDIGIGGGFHRDAVWSYNQIPQELGAVVPPSLHIFQRELKVPVEIVFAVGELGPAPPMIPTLNKIVDVARTTIDQIRTA